MGYDALRLGAVVDDGAGATSDCNCIRCARCGGPIGEWDCYVLLGDTGERVHLDCATAAEVP